MRITLELPEELGRYLGQDTRALSRTAFEALVLEGVRSGALSTAQARRFLGFRTRNQMDGFLKAHGIDLALTIDQVQRDSADMVVCESTFADSEAALAFSRIPSSLPTPIL